MLTETAFPWYLQIVQNFGCICLNFYFSTWDLDIRLGFDLCKEEREFLDKRKKIISEALTKTLHLKDSPPKDEVLSTVL